MCNYIINGNIDFYAELLNDSDDDNTDYCLLTGENLTYNHIVLQCNHKFNYLPLYNEVISQKITKKSYGMLDNVRLGLSQFKCPYCRTISNRLLPYIPEKDTKYKYSGVNYPEGLCMEHRKCEHLFACGKEKNEPCNKNAFESKYGTFCQTHWKVSVNRALAQEKNKEIKVKKEIDLPQPWTNEMQDMFKKLKIVDLRNELRKHGLKVGGTKHILVHRIVTTILH
jgi:hypothetical protein